MERYRIVRETKYSGCIPITTYFVQVRKESRLSYGWTNIKGFDTYKKAKELSIPIISEEDLIVVGCLIYNIGEHMSGYKKGLDNGMEIVLKQLKKRYERPGD